jgi:hypothetical protein
MTIAYTSVTLSDSSVTLREKPTIRVVLTNSPNGTVYGAVVVGNADTGTSRSIELRYLSLKNYVAELWGGRIGRHTSTPIKVWMSDDDGVVEYGSALSITVTESSEPYVVRPATWVKDTLDTYWDTTHVGKPLFLYPYERKAKSKIDMMGHIEIVEGKAETEIHGRGDYKTNRYPIELIARCTSDDKCQKLIAQSREVLETYWNDMNADGMDYIEWLPDDAQNLSVEMAGQFEWRQNFKIVGALRGRAGTPQEPRPVGGEEMEDVATLPSATDARLNVLYKLQGGTGVSDKIYAKLKKADDTYIMKLVSEGV